MQRAASLLVIDDSSTVRKVVELALRPLEVVVHFAGTGQQGLELARAARPEVIVLDFVLPDMRGTDVCAALQREPELAHTRVVLVSGKSHEVRGLFRDHPAVVGHLGKPFSASELIGLVAPLLGRETQASAGLAPGGDRPPARAEADAAVWQAAQPAAIDSAARAIYARLRPGLARMADWIDELGSEATASALARRLLTRDVVSGIAGALATPGTGAAEEAAAGAAPAAPVPGSLSIDLASVAMTDLLRTLGAARQTGVVSTRRDGAEHRVYLLRGAVLMATSTDVDRYLHAAGELLAGVPAEALRQARQHQEQTGTPLLVTLHQHGLLPAVDPVRALAERSEVVLDAILPLDRGWASFAPRSLPDHAEALGRAQPVRQVLLQHRRRHPLSGVLEAALADLGAILERAPASSQHVGELELVAEERQLLAAVDGRTPVGAVIERAGVSTQAGRAALSRLTEVGLLRFLRAGRTDAASGGAPLRPVVLVGARPPGLHGVLEEQLRGSIPAARVVAIDGSEEAAGRIIAEKPALVLFDIGEDPTWAVEAVQMLSGAHELGCARIAAMVTPQPDRSERALEGRGFDAVLAKPVHVSEIERLLGAS